MRAAAAGTVERETDAVGGGEEVPTSSHLMADENERSWVNSSSVPPPQSHRQLWGQPRGVAGSPSSLALASIQICIFGGKELTDPQWTLLFSRLVECDSL